MNEVLAYAFYEFFIIITTLITSILMIPAGTLIFKYSFSLYHIFHKNCDCSRQFYTSSYISIVELSHKTGLAKTTLTSMLDRMEEMKLIVRAADKKDRRQIRIMLTENARSLSGECDNVSDRMDKLYYAGFTQVYR